MIFRDWLDKLEYRLIQGDLDKPVTEVVYDSRKAAVGAVFVCIKGTRVDSHDFIPEAVKAGARVLVAEREPEEALAGVTVILVPDGRKALALLSAARFGYPIEKMISIGVTGTKGKTTTAHMIKAILETCGKKVGMVGTTGVVIGSKVTPTVNTTPESYRLQESFAGMVKAGCEYVVLEVSSQAFKMNRVAGITLDYGIFTNISPDHIGPDEHADFLEYLYYKSQIFCCSRQGLLNADDEHAQTMAANASCPVATYGLHTAADFMAKEIHFVSEPGFMGLEFDVTGACELKARVAIPGEFNVYNGLAAISVCSFLGLPEERVSHALEHMSVNGRMEIVYTSKRCTVIVDYAHNAVSMESLLSTLKEYRPARLVCVFGCGGNRSKDRRYSMGDSAGRLADFTILTADNSRFERTEDIIKDIRSSLEKTGGAFIEIPDRREAIVYSLTHALPGDMIAIIGKGHEDYQELNGVRQHFSDREEVLLAAARLEGKTV